MAAVKILSRRLAVSKFRTNVLQKFFIAHKNCRCISFSRCLTTDTTLPIPNKENQVLCVSKTETPKEKFIPVTRHSLIRHLMERQEFFTNEEKKIFEAFSLSLDHALLNRYHGILEELKVLFDPINPDKETKPLRPVTQKDRLDNEFWLLQRLEDVLERANFHEIPKSVVAAALKEHNAKEGVQVSVDTTKYDVLRFWALGKEYPSDGATWFATLFSKLRGHATAAPTEYYKRIISAIRLKKDDKLILKSFKEVPVDSLEMLLPNGHISLRTLDRGILMTSCGLAISGIVAKIVTYLAGYTVDWALLVTVVTGAIGVQAWTMYKNRRNAYVTQHARMLYFKNIANNRGLLALLVDRAQDESLKEALLTYSFLLTNRPDYSRLVTASNESLPVEIGALPEPRLERIIEDWVSATFSVDIDYDCKESVKILEYFGILNQLDDKLQVLPMHAAIKNLPQKPHSLVARAMDSDLAEGYDRDILCETDAEYKKGDRKTRLFGWF